MSCLVRPFIGVLSVVSTLLTSSRFFSLSLRIFSSTVSRAMSL